MALYTAGAGKDVSGPNPYDQFPTSVNSGSVIAQDFDPARIEDAIQAFRAIWNHEIPTFDENGPKWLKATRVERRAAKSAAENWVKYNRDPVPAISEALESGRGNEFFAGYSRGEYAPGAPKSYVEAELEVARFATYGVKARIEGFEAPPATHRVSFHDLSRGPC